ncbi:MAG: pyridoxal phosphate-dependent aminotransferase [Rhodothermales bacterium]
MAKRKRPAPDIHLNLNIRGLGPSATLAINERCNALREQGQTVFKLGLGQSPFPIPESVVEALRVNAHQKNYLPVKGLPALREAVAGYHCRVNGLACSGADVLIGPGSKELMFLLQLTYYGDLVIPTPSWVSYAPQARIIGRQIRWLPTQAEHAWHLTPDELERLGQEDPGRPRLLILNYPANPTGSTYTTDDLKALARITRRYRMVVLSDEIYGELHHKGQHVSIARYYPEGTIISAGLSKWCGAGGWRLGTFTFPESLHWLADTIASTASETYTSTNAPIQFAAVRGFQGGPDIDDYLVQSRRILRALGRHCAQRLSEAGACVCPPRGAFYLFPDFAPFRETLQKSGITTSQSLCEQLLQDTGVAILPGSVFGRPEDELTARLAYVDFDGAAALEAARTVRSQPLGVSFLKTYCAPVMTAIDRLCDWLHNYSP